MLWLHAKNKKAARRFALPNASITRGIWLPADKALCVRLAYEERLMSNTKQAILVERKTDIFNKMLESTTDIPGRFPFEGDLTKLKLNDNIDYAFLDYFGGVNSKNGMWMATELTSHLKKGATICITQMLSCRNNKIMCEQDSWLRTPVGSFIRHNYGTLKLPYQRILLLLHRIFRDWDFEVVPNENGSIYEYSDSVSTMLLLKLTNFRKSTNAQFFPFFNVKGTV